MLKAGKIASVMMVVLFLAACASNPPAPPGTVNVLYTKKYPDDSALKEQPTEVMIVTRAKTAKAVAGSVAMGAVAAATFGIFGAVPTFSKNDLKGNRIEVVDRRNIRNPIPIEFTRQLGEKVNAAVQAEPSLRERQFSKAVLVAGGSVRLIYDTLLSGEESFRLRTELKVWTPGNALNPLSSPYVVDCDEVSSEALPQAVWAQEDYQLVATRLGNTLSACEQKVLTALPKLLR